MAQSRKVFSRKVPITPQDKPMRAQAYEHIFWRERKTDLRFTFGVSI